MNIQEEPLEKKICIRKFKFSCDDEDPSIPEPLPKSLNHFLLLCGRPGSSKTTLILNLIAKRGKNYNNKFDRVYVFSPSLGTMDNNPFEDLPEDQVYTELNPENLQGVMDDIADSGDKVLLIIDDCVNDMRKNMEVERLMAKILMNRRHLCGSGGSLSAWITSQVYNKIPAPVRKTASHIVMYNTKSKRELDTIFDETITIPKDDFYRILNYCFKGKYDFMFLDLTKSHKGMFHRNFNKLKYNLKSDVDLGTR